MPLSIITLRLQTGRHEDSDESGMVKQEPEARENAVIQTVKKIYEEQGFSGFWRGMLLSLFRGLPPLLILVRGDRLQYIDPALAKSINNTGVLSALPAITSIDSSTTLEFSALIVDPTPGEAFFGGAISNSIGRLNVRFVIKTLRSKRTRIIMIFVCLAVALLYPLILSKTRLQASRSRSINSFGSSESQSTSRPKTLGAVMLDAYHGRYHHGTSSTSSTSDKQVRRASGINSLYQGLEMQILKGFLNQGVTFLVKGR